MSNFIKVANAAAVIKKINNYAETVDKKAA